MCKPGAVQKRFPNKILKPLIDGKSSLQLIIDKLKLSQFINEIVVTTSNHSVDKKLGSLFEDDAMVFFGDENNVLQRFQDACNFYNPDIIVRITADCPVLDYKVVDECISVIMRLPEVEYVSNTLPPTFPDGLDVEVFTKTAFNRCVKNSLTSFEQEHVTPWLRQSDEVVKHNISSPVDLSDYRLTFDDDRDYIVLKKLFERFGADVNFETLVENTITLNDIGAKVEPTQRNYGLMKQSGEKVYERAKNVILNGGSLLSKRPEMFLSKGWPTYFSAAKGCSVWDLDGNHFYDFGLMGVGTNILGYGDSVVDDAVKQCIEDGNMSSLNSEEEVLLAEKLIEMHPWASFAKFARTGGEANSIALRIARCTTGPKRTGVAVCGYHGWHDWYPGLEFWKQ